MGDLSFKKDMEMGVLKHIAGYLEPNSRTFSYRMSRQNRANLKSNEGKVKSLKEEKKALESIDSDFTAAGITNGSPHPDIVSLDEQIAKTEARVKRQKQHARNDLDKAVNDLKWIWDSSTKFDLVFPPAQAGHVPATYRGNSWAHHMDLGFLLNDSSDDSDA